YGADGNGIMQPQMALVSIDPHTGYIKAMVGGRGTDQFNRATMAERQPGSAFKPFVFIAALENDFSPSTIIDDSPITIGDWSPQNDSRRFSGKVTMRTVATYSMNVPTVKIAQKLGMDKPIYYAQEMGITTFVLDGPTNDRNLSSALGGLTKGVTPLELTSAYGTFANNGVHVDPIAIIKVLDRNGKIIEQAEPQEHSVVSAESAAALTSMLQDVITSGTGTRANIGRPAAGKTGTTSDYHDAWFVGYTPDLVAGVWVGDDNNNSLAGMGGGTVPATIWRSFMESAVANMPVRQFEGYYGGGGVSELRSENSTGSRSENAESEQESRHSEPKRDHYEAPAPQSHRAAEPEAPQPAQPEPVRSEPVAPAPAPAAPEPSGGGGGAAPTPGGGGGKSRN
ncbi:MAG: penicillin-binding protein, partial [Selenomonadaceae bacterium]|nr:penicillin-binding protein [Selenomonadaceae bacterium]